MAKSNTASKILPTQSEVVDKVNSLQVRGVEISIMIEEIDFKRNVTLKKWFSVDSNFDGYGYKLGKLLSDLRQVNPEAKQIPQELLKECSLDKIDRRRRSEWEWFYNHQSELDEFFCELAKARKCSKMAVRQNFSSITALKRAYVEATQKPSNEDSKPSKGKAKGSDSTTKGTEKVSNVGQLSPKEMAIAVANALKDEQSQKDFLYWFKASVEANQTF